MRIELLKEQSTRSGASGKPATPSRFQSDFFGGAQDQFVYQLGVDSMPTCAAHPRYTPTPNPPPPKATKPRTWGLHPLALPVVRSMVHASRRSPGAAPGAAAPAPSRSPSSPRLRVSDPSRKPKVEGRGGTNPASQPIPPGTLVEKSGQPRAAAGNALGPRNLWFFLFSNPVPKAFVIPTTGKGTHLFFSDS